MHAIQVAYAMYFNLKYKRRGHLFQDRFSSWVIKDEHHLLATKEYIENNPIKAGITILKEDYPWSSAFRDGSVVTLSPVGG
jgi:REP element-mobilizing transposase RayT